MGWCNGFRSGDPWRKPKGIRYVEFLDRTGTEAAMEKCEEVGRERLTLSR